MCFFFISRLPAPLMSLFVGVVTVTIDPRHLVKMFVANILVGSSRQKPWCLLRSAHVWTLSLLFMGPIV